MSVFDDVLNELGWQSGFQIPVANFENQKLQEELAKLTLQRVKLKTLAENVREKHDNLENHLKYIQEGQIENQKLITVYRQQLESESIKLRSTQTENDRVSKEIQELRQNLSEIGQRQRNKEQQLEKYIKTFERLQSETKWDSEALDVWDESIKKREDDNELIKKFSRDDEIKYNELEAKRMHLEAEYTRRKDTVNQLMNEIHKYETMVERTGQIIKQQFDEKEELIKCWKDSVKILQQRNNEIKKIQHEMIEIKQRTDGNSEKLDEQKQFYQNQIRNNDEIERENRELNILNSKLRLNANELSQQTLLLLSEADTMRRLVLTTANQLDRQRKELKLLDHNIEIKQQYIEKYQQIVEHLELKLTEVEKTKITSKERYQHLEKLLSFEMKQENYFIKNLEALQMAQFKDNEEYKRQLDRGKSIEYELSGMIMAMKNIRKRNQEVEKDVEKLNELIYNIEFRIDETNEKIKKILATDTSKEDEEELMKAKEVEDKFNELIQTRNLLNDQVTKIRNDMRRLQQQINNDHDKITALESKLHTQLLNREGGEKQLIQHRAQLQQLQVDQSILYLRINHMEKTLKNENNSMYSSQKYRLNLEQLMMERLLEVNKTYDILQVKRRNLLEDKSRIKMDFGERQARLEQFKKKYDITMMCLGSDGEGKPLSITSLKIKNAQEKYMLQQEGDELDKKIRKAEHEIIAMENTLKVINQTNAAFKNSLSSVDEQDDEVNEMRQLDKEILLINDCLRESRKELINLNSDLDIHRNSYQDLINKKLEYCEILENHKDQYIELRKAYDTRREKIVRTENCIKSIKKRLYKKKTSLETYEQDFDLRQLRRCNNNAIKCLTNLQDKYEEIITLIKNYESTYNLRLSEQSGDISSSSSSTKSSRSTCSKPSKNSLNKKKSSPINVSMAKVDLTLNI